MLIPKFCKYLVTAPMAASECETVYIPPKTIYFLSLGRVKADIISTYTSSACRESTVFVFKVLYSSTLSTSCHSLQVNKYSLSMVLGKRNGFVPLLLMPCLNVTRKSVS